MRSMLMEMRSMRSMLMVMLMWKSWKRDWLLKQTEEVPDCEYKHFLLWGSHHNNSIPILSYNLENIRLLKHYFHRHILLQDLSIYLDTLIKQCYNFWHPLKEEMNATISTKSNEKGPFLCWPIETETNLTVKLKEKKRQTTWQINSNTNWKNIDLKPLSRVQRYCNQRKLVLLYPHRIEQNWVWTFLTKTRENSWKWRTLTLIEQVKKKRKSKWVLPAPEYPAFSRARVKFVSRLLAISCAAVWRRELKNKGYKFPFTWRW